mgnify:FL=1
MVLWYPFLEFQRLLFALLGVSSNLQRIRENIKIMKKNAFLCVIMVCISILSGCGAGDDVSSEPTIEKNIKYVTNDNAAASMIEAEQETGSEIPDSDTGENDTEDNDTEENDIQENNEQYNDTGAVSDEKQLTGSVEVIKKAEFVLLTDDGTYYEFLFKKKPSGLREIEAGTRVTVTYNGDISEDNIISGGIISIEIQ